MTKRKITKSTT